ncbi:YqfO family protein [bacterium]|nr:YqfO family protein [bacterium]
MNETLSFSYCKLEIFVPETHLEPLRRALQEADAGHIGNYDSCLSYSRVTGCWRPLEGTNPYIGSAGEISSEPELKVEVTVKAERLDETIAAVKRVHPYEEPVINAIPLLRTSF